MTSRYETSIPVCWRNASSVGIVALPLTFFVSMYRGQLAHVIEPLCFSELQSNSGAPVDPGEPADVPVLLHAAISGASATPPSPNARRLGICQREMSRRPSPLPSHTVRLLPPAHTQRQNTNVRDVNGTRGTWMR